MYNVKLFAIILIMSNPCTNNVGVRTEITNSIELNIFNTDLIFDLENPMNI